MEGRDAVYEDFFDTYRNESYNQVVWRKVVLYPKKTGKLLLEPLSLNLSVGLPTQKRDFLYADDCCAGLEKIMLNFNKFKKNKYPIDLASGKNTSIIKIAKVIQKLFLKKKIIIKIQKSKNKDLVQLDKKNKPNMFLKKYWKPTFSLEDGIEKIINYYQK